MNEKEIIETFLDMGVQLSSEALSIIKKNPHLIEQIKKEETRPFIITGEHLKKIMNLENEATIKTIKIFSLKSDKIRIEDYVTHLHSRYEKMKDLILKNNPEKVISINKITENTLKFTIIGIVRNKTQNSVTIEDMTGEINVIFDGILKYKLSEIGEDDVIGLTCRKEKNRYIASKIIFPDIPLNREVAKSNKDIKIFVSSKIVKDEDDKTLINLEDVKEPEMKEYQNIKFLIIPKSFFQRINANVNSDFLQTILKKRHIYSCFIADMSFGEDQLVLEQIPDIIISDLSPRMCKNYKGTTIISVPENERGFIVNLKTREVADNF